MKVNSITLHPYSISFKRPFVTSRGAIKERKGLLIKITRDDGKSGVGDIAPLTDFNTETLNEAYLQAESVARQINGSIFSADWRELFQALPVSLFSSVRFGFEAGLLDLLGVSTATPCAAILSPHCSFRIPVNGLLPFMESESFDTYKLKIGSRSVKEELELVDKASLELPPSAKLRLDCNQAYSFEEAKRLVLELEGRQEIEYIEEPLKAPSLESLFQLAKMSTQVALDESLVEQEILSAVISGELQVTPVIKPTVLGGISRTIDLFESLQHQGRSGVITSTLESIVGVTACAHLAAAVPNKLACGLSTGLLFTRDLGESRGSIVNGVFNLPQAPGLGVKVKWESL